MYNKVIIFLSDVTIDPGKLNLPKNDATKVDSALENGLNLIFGIFASVAVLMVSIGALKMIMSRGNPQEVAKARDTVIYASIGLVISIMAYTIVGFAIGSI